MAAECLMSQVCQGRSNGREWPLSCKLSGIRDWLLLADTVSTWECQEAARRRGDVARRAMRSSRQFHAVGEMGWASRYPRLLSNIGRPAIRVVQISVCSEISKASSTSMPRYLTVDSSLEWPNSSCTARRFFVRR